MKNVFKLASITAALALISGVVNASDNIAYVNPNYLMQNHPLLTDPNSEFVKEAKAVESTFAEEEKKLAEQEKALADEAAKLQEEDKKVGDSIKKKSEALEKEAPRLRSADIKKRQDAINAEAQTFQKKVNAFQQREMDFRKNVDDFQQRLGAAQRQLTEKQNAIQKNIIGEVEKAIADAAKAQGYTLILDATAVLYTENEKRDLTEDVYKSLGGKVPAQQPAAK